MLNVFKRFAEKWVCLTYLNDLQKVFVQSSGNLVALAGNKVMNGIG